MREDTLAGFLDPGTMIDHLNLQPGDFVADFGCGAGHFSLEAARRVGENGTVRAFDILPSAIEAIKSTIKIENIKNILVRRADLERENGSKLKDESMDGVIVKDILFQNDDKGAILKEAYRVLKKDGELLVIEWNMENMTLGPEEKLRISSMNLKELVNASGFFVERELLAGDYHFAIVAKKK